MVTSSTAKSSVHRQKGTLHKASAKMNVEIVLCAAAFPISQKLNKQRKSTDGEPTTKSATMNTGNKSNKSELLDWNETVREVHKFGASGWKQDSSILDPNNPLAHGTNSLSDRKKYRLHKEEEYKRLTGRTMKHHSVPLPIVRGIKKKAKQRELRHLQEAKNAGIILPATSSSTRAKQDEKKRKNFTTNRVYGPAPSIGFVKQGVFRVQGKKK